MGEQEYNAKRKYDQLFEAQQDFQYLARRTQEAAHKLQSLMQQYGIVECEPTLKLVGLPKQAEKPQEDKKVEEPVPTNGESKP